MLKDILEELTFLGGLLILVILLAVCAKPFGYFSKTIEIDATLEAGSPSVHLPREVSIYRPHEVELIKSRFMMKKKVYTFGVVLGPSGTGRTYVTRLACSLYPSGVIYYEIYHPSFLAVNLARVVGMKLRDNAKILDVLFEKLGISALVGFYTLPEDLSEALTVVLETVAERAALYKKRHGRVVCIFIDGIDLLAKEHPQVFVGLVDLAKYYASRGSLLLVFVSSEGHIVPLMDTISSSTRKGKVIEILDMNETVSGLYLTRRGIPDGLVNRIISLTGGRFMYLNGAIQEYNIGVATGLSEDDVFKHIEESLMRPFFWRKAAVMGVYPNATTLMNLVYLNGSIKPARWLLSLDEAQREPMRDTIKGLVELNLLRYTADGLLSLHSQVVYAGMESYKANYGHHFSEVGL
jgi:hypothetical protein